MLPQAPPCAPPHSVHRFSAEKVSATLAKTDFADQYASFIANRQASQLPLTTLGLPPLPPSAAPIVRRKAFGVKDTRRAAGQAPPSPVVTRDISEDDEPARPRLSHDSSSSPAELTRCLSTEMHTYMLHSLLAEAARHSTLVHRRKHQAGRSSSSPQAFGAGVKWAVPRKPSTKPGLNVSEPKVYSALKKDIDVIMAMTPPPPQLSLSSSAEDMNLTTCTTKTASTGVVSDYYRYVLEQLWRSRLWSA